MKINTIENKDALETLHEIRDGYVDLLLTESLLREIREHSKAQTGLLQEIYKQILNPWTGRNQFTQPDSQFFLINDDGKMKTSEILNLCKEKFDVYCYYSNEQLDKNFPPVKSSRKFKKLVEADPELADKSADDLERENIKGITFRERLLLELQYFNETGNHLDITNITLCSGSRDSDGDVPSVSWFADYRRLYILWYHSQSHDGNLRARASL